MKAVPISGVNMRDTRQVKTFPSLRAFARFIGDEASLKTTIANKSLSNDGGFVQGERHEWFVCPRGN